MCAKDGNSTYLSRQDGEGEDRQPVAKERERRGKEEKKKLEHVQPEKDHSKTIHRMELKSCSSFSLL